MSDFFGPQSFIELAASLAWLQTDPLGSDLDGIDLDTWSPHDLANAVHLRFPGGWSSFRNAVVWS